MSLSIEFANLLLFLVIFSLVFYSIGFSLIGWVDRDLQAYEKISISFIVGIIIFVMSAYIFGILNLRFLMLPLILSYVLISFWKNFKILFKPWSQFLKNKTLMLIIFFGIIIQGFINFPSGYLYQNGLNFWSSQGHDGLWHVASMEEIKRTLPPQNPVFSNEPLLNYHYLVDILMGEFGRIFPFFSSLDLYFRFFPVVFSFLMGLAIFSLITRWKNNQKIGLLAVALTYFTGSFGFIVSLQHGGSIFGGETAFWAAQQNTLIGNPPHAISHSILPTFLLAVYMYLQKRNKAWFVLACIIGSTLAGYKVSGGIVMLVGLGTACIVDLVVNRRIGVVLLTVLVGVFNFLTIKSMTSPQANSFLMFLPWWFIRTMVVAKLGWMDLELRRQHYLSKGTWHAMLRVLQIETTAFLIFVVGNLGMRILGIIAIVKDFFLYGLTAFKKPFEMMMLMIMLTGLIIPIFFVQKGIIYNNIQFMQYFLLIFGFYEAVTIYQLFARIKNRLFKLGLALLIILASIPTVIGNLVEFYGPNTHPLAVISKESLEALNYLKKHSDPQSVVLSMSFNPNLKNSYRQPPIPIYAWYDTPYISALSARRSYLASEQITLLDYPTTKQRQENVVRFFKQADVEWNRSFLKQANISYVYINKDEIRQPISWQNYLQPFFENNAVTIYQVKL